MRPARPRAPAVTTLDSMQRGGVRAILPAQMTALLVDDHPQLALEAFVARWPRPLPELPSPPWLEALRTLDAETPLPPPDDAVKAAVAAATGRAAA